MASWDEYCDGEYCGDQGHDCEEEDPWQQDAGDPWSRGYDGGDAAEEEESWQVDEQYRRHGDGSEEYSWKGQRGPGRAWGDDPTWYDEDGYEDSWHDAYKAQAAGQSDEDWRRQCLKEGLCFKCGESGHYAADCPADDKGTTQNYTEHVDIGVYTASSTARGSAEHMVTSSSLRRGRYRRTAISHHAAEIYSQLKQMKADSNTMHSMVLGSIIDNRDHFAFISTLAIAQKSEIERQIKEVSDLIFGGADEIATRISSLDARITSNQHYLEHALQKEDLDHEPRKGKGKGKYKGKSPSVRPPLTIKEDDYSEELFSSAKAAPISPSKVKLVDTLTETQIEDFKGFFDEHADADGFVPSDSVGELLVTLGHKPKQAEIVRTNVAARTMGDGLDFRRFLRVVSEFVDGRSTATSSTTPASEFDLFSRPPPASRLEGEADSRHASGGLTWDGDI